METILDPENCYYIEVIEHPKTGEPHTVAWFLGKRYGWNIKHSEKHRHSDRKTPRAGIRYFKRKYTYLHIEIWKHFKGEIPKGTVIDHVNRNTFDNRLSNLRIVDSSMNAYNKKSFRRKKKIDLPRGVWLDQKRAKAGYKKHYRARVIKNKKTVFCSYHETAQEASEAYNKAALEHYGELV